VQELRRGITIDGVMVTPEEVRPLRETPDGLLLKIVIQEGRNRIVRRMFDAVRYPVLRLVRTRVGPIQLGNLPKGAWRDLTGGELAQLREAVGFNNDEDRSERRRGPPARRQRRGR